MVLLLVISLVIGTVIALLALPLMLRKFGMNGPYGYRNKITTRNIHIWYAVNEYFGRRLFWVGVTVDFAALLLYPVPNMRAEMLGFVVVVVLLVNLGFTFVQTRNYIKAYERGEDQ